MPAPNNDSGDRIKGPWSRNEDDLLRRLVQRHGARNWSLIGKSIPGRSEKSCRLRWCNQLCPEVAHRSFTAEEDMIILEAQSEYGNKWATIARLLIGRTDNAIKNHWNSTLKLKLAGMRVGEERPPQNMSLNPGEQLSNSNFDISDSGNVVSFCFPVMKNALVVPQAESLPVVVADMEDCDEDEFTTLTLGLPGTRSTRSSSSENESGEKEAHMNHHRYSESSHCPAEEEDMEKKPVSLCPELRAVM